jgi:hypothetical protein
MLEVAMHVGGKKCECLFCLMKCPECGTSFDSLQFSVSYRMAKDGDTILMHGGVDVIVEDTDLGLIASGCAFECSECGAEFSEERFIKLQKALFSIVGGNVKINRKKDGEMEISRFVSVGAPVFEEI